MPVITKRGINGWLLVLVVAGNMGLLSLLAIQVSQLQKVNLGRNYLQLWMACREQVIRFITLG